MSQHKGSIFNSYSLYKPVLIILYLCIGFIPNMDAVDKIAPQWLALSILNLSSILIFSFYRKAISKNITSSIISSTSLIYFAFIIWASISYYYAINPTETIVNITRQLNVFLMYLSLGILLYDLKNKKEFISWILTIILIVEVYFVLNQLLELINTTGIISNRSLLKGVAANPNITAFSITAKIPFLIYLVFFSKKELTKIFLSFVLIGSLICISVIQSRASFIAIGFVYIIAFIIFYFLNRIHVLRVKVKNIIYILLPLIFSITINSLYFASKGADAINRFNSISISTSDASIGARIRYYSHVLKHIKSSPIIGVGFGNWKLKSIDYDSKDIEGYVVPYHAHSDFIQIGAELGILGLLLYMSIFLFTVYSVFILIFNSNIETKEKVYILTLLAALGVYSIDANLNFPIARPQVLVTWAIVVASIMVYYQKIKHTQKIFKAKNNFNLIFLSISILALIPTTYVTNSVFKSLKGQMILLQDFNSNQYNLPLNKIETIVPEIPNITVTTIPINSIKARYYVNSKKYKKAIDLLETGTKANPYLFYSEILKSQIYEELGKLDSAKFYAKKAFFGLPNNDLHSSRYINLINLTRDKDALENAFELLTINNKKTNWKNYLIISDNLKTSDDQILIKRAKKSTEIFPYDNDIKNLYNQILIGKEFINKANSFSKKGLEYFNNKDYVNAALQFELAIESNPRDYANYENAATSNYLIGNLNKALYQINKVINELNIYNGKCEYIKALIFIKMGDPIGACPLLETSRDSGYFQAENLISQYCQF